LSDIATTKKDVIKPKLISMASTDAKSSVRVAALGSLYELYENDEDVSAIVRKALTDSSYNVMCKAMTLLSKINAEEALKFAGKMESEKNSDVLITIADIYSTKGTDANNDFFVTAYRSINGFDKYSFVNIYSKYLSGNRGMDAINKGLPMLEDMAVNSGAWWMRLVGIQTISELSTTLSNKQIEVQLKSDELLKSDPKSAEGMQLRKDAEATKAMNEKVSALLKDIKSKEKDKNVLKALNMGASE
jgi:hypothetical protein